MVHELHFRVCLVYHASFKLQYQLSSSISDVLVSWQITLLHITLYEHLQEHKNMAPI